MLFNILPLENAILYCLISLFVFFYFRSKTCYACNINASKNRF